MRLSRTQRRATPPHPPNKQKFLLLLSKRRLCSFLQKRTKKLLQLSRLTSKLPRDGGGRRQIGAACGSSARQLAASDALACMGVPHPVQQVPNRGGISHGVRSGNTPSNNPWAYRPSWCRRALGGVIPHGGCEQRYSNHSEWRAGR